MDQTDFDVLTGSIFFLAQARQNAKANNEVVSDHDKLVIKTVVIKALKKMTQDV